MFETWTDAQFAAWLAGFFDGEGCIYIPQAPGIELSIANTNREVIDAIHRRLDIGVIMEVTFDQEGWKPKYHWRVRTYDEAYALLKLIRPYLVIKASKADQASQLIERFLEKRRAISDRNAEIINLARRHPELSHKEIAERFGLGRTSVTQILTAAEMRRNARPKERLTFRQGRQRYLKKKVHPKTSAKKLH